MPVPDHRDSGRRNEILMLVFSEYEINEIAQSLKPMIAEVRSDPTLRLILAHAARRCTCR